MDESGFVIVEPATVSAVVVILGGLLDSVAMVTSFF